MRCRHFSNVKIGDIRCRTKCLDVGARAGLPFREEVPEELIVPFVASTAELSAISRKGRRREMTMGAISASSRIIFLFTK